MGCSKHASQQVSFLVRNPQNANLTLLSRSIFHSRRWWLDCNESYITNCIEILKKISQRREYRFIMNSQRVRFRALLSTFNCPKNEGLVCLIAFFDMPCLTYFQIYCSPAVSASIKTAHDKIKWMLFLECTMHIFQGSGKFWRIYRIP